MEEGYVSLAMLPKDNDFLLAGTGKAVDYNKLDTLIGYTVPLIAHDYGAKTPLMWNTLYAQLGLHIRNIMVIADPKNAGLIFDAFRADPKYLGGGLGVGFKERIQGLDGVVPADLGAANIVVKQGEQLMGYNTDAQGFVKSLEDKFNGIGKHIEGSNIVILGAGGVAKEVVKLLAEKGVKRMALLNRTASKAVSLAYEINRNFGDRAVAGGENIIRGYLLNSFTPPDAVINLTDKGSDGTLVGVCAFAAAGESNGYISRDIARELANLNPDIIVADIVLPKGRPSITLRTAKNEGLTNLLDGVPMVVNQAAPAYVLVQKAHQDKHAQKVTEEQALEIFRKAAA